MADSREQTLINIAWEMVELVVASATLREMTRDKRAEWVRDQLLSNGFHTQPIGLLHHALVNDGLISDSKLDLAFARGLLSGLGAGPNQAARLRRAAENLTVEAHRILKEP